MTPNTSRISVVLPDAVLTLANRLAALEGRSMSNLTAYAIESWLHANFDDRLRRYSENHPTTNSED